MKHHAEPKITKNKSFMAATLTSEGHLKPIFDGETSEAVEKWLDDEIEMDINHKMSGRFFVVPVIQYTIDYYY